MFCNPPNSLVVVLVPWPRIAELALIALICSNRTTNTITNSEIESVICLKTLRTSIFICIVLKGEFGIVYFDQLWCINSSVLSVLFIYDTSFLKGRQVVIKGDVESNPGLVTNTPKHAGRHKKSRR